MCSGLALLCCPQCWWLVFFTRVTLAAEADWYLVQLPELVLLLDPPTLILLLVVCRSCVLACCCVPFSEGSIVIAAW